MTKQPEPKGPLPGKRPKESSRQEPDVIAGQPVDQPEVEQGEPAPFEVLTLLDRAVAQLAGSQRPGQQQMTQAVAQALANGQHLLVEAGTGVGKTLAYLIPALAFSVVSDQTVVVATATLALQRQIMEKDLPLALAALEGQLMRQPTGALLMGRSNYLCRAKLAGDYPDQDEALFELEPAVSPPLVESSTGWVAEVRRLHQWAKQTPTGQREHFDGGVSNQAWRQVSVSGLECMGSKCHLLDQCFAEQARSKAGLADLVVTNHALVALDLAGSGVLPSFAAMVVDEAHQLTSSLTNAYTASLSNKQVLGAVKALERLKVDSAELEKAGRAVESELQDANDGWFRAGLPDRLALAVAGLRSAARQALSEVVKTEGGANNQATSAVASRQQASAALEQLVEVCDRLRGSEHDAQIGPQVAWLTRAKRGHLEGDPVLHVAPRGVASLVRERLFDQVTTVMTSATIQVGGRFYGPATAVGLAVAEQGDLWRGLAVESPFDYQKQAILYLASQLPAPDREGLVAADQHQIMSQLIEASGGGALGLFTSQLAAERAAEAVGAQVAYPVLCQGQTSLGALVDQFLAEDQTCLFGTLSLWQGLDAPGQTCRLVMIDRLPFPRPDEPLAQARTQAANQAGRNGFMEVAASQAAVLLAQGVGRLIRRSSDRGVVAVLDSRLATARYGGFLLAGLPPLWRTENLDLVIEALERLAPQPETNPNQA